MKKIKIMILTTRFGGPYKWAKEFKEYCGRNKLPIEISCKSRFPSLLFSPFSVGNCDVVHAVQPITIRLWKKPVVLNIRGNYKEEFNLRNLWAPLYGIAARLADKIVVPSAYLKRKLNLKDADVIPNCVDVDNYPKKKGYAMQNKVRIVTATSFAFKDKARGVLSLVKILCGVNSGKSIELAVLGGGSYLKMVISEVKNIAMPKSLSVTFTGKVDNVNDYLVDSDIFAYYSTHDNFPNSLLEAMACGLPAITNDVGAVREMIENGREGFIAESDKEYAELVKVLIKDHKKREWFGENAVKKVREKFSWKVNAKKWYAVYKGLLDKKCAE